MYNTIKDCFIIFKNIVKLIFSKCKSEIVQDDPEELDTIKFKEETEEDQIELDGIIFMDKYESKDLKDKITNELKDLVKIINIANVEKVGKVELKGMALIPDFYNVKSNLQKFRPQIKKGVNEEFYEEFDDYLDIEKEKK